MNVLGWTATVWLVAFSVRLIRLDHTPLWDELYHFLAAQSWLQNGSFAIAGGEYTRAPLFTIIVAEFMHWFGTSLVVARLPSVLAGSLAVALLYRFTANQAGRNAGLFSAGLLCFHPVSIYLGQYARFYALHGLCFLVGAYAFFRAVNALKFDRQAGLWVVLSVASLVLAYQFQITTLIGVGALLIWFGLRVGWFWILRFLRGEWRAAWVFTGLVVTAAAAFWMAIQVGFVRHLLRAFSSAPVWASELVTDTSFYHHWMLHETPLLWACFPVAALIAMRQRPAFVFFCTTIFAVIFVVHSLAADKAQRYIFYGLPFFFAIWGIALPVIIPELLRMLREIVAAWLGSSASEKRVHVIAIIGGAILAGMLLILNPATVMTCRMLCQPDAKWSMPQHYRGFADWQAAAMILKPLAQESDAVITSCNVKSLYFLGRSDYELSVTARAEAKENKEFGIDPRTGNPTISTAQSLETLMHQHRSGLVVVEQSRWRLPMDVPNKTADYIEAHMSPVLLPQEWRLLAFRWQH